MGISSLSHVVDFVLPPLSVHVRADRQRCSGFTLYHRRLPRHGTVDRSRILVVVVSLLLITLCARLSSSWPLCVAFISVCCFHLGVLFPSSLNVRLSYTTNDADSQGPQAFWIVRSNHLDRWQ